MWNDVVAIIVTTIVLGSIYGLVAIGMSLIYGTLRILDMSQGSMVMVGSFVAWGLLSSGRAGVALTLLAAIVLTFLLGAATELVSVQPLVGRSGIDFEMVTFITTFGVSIVFTNIALQVFGPFQRNVPPLFKGSIQLAGVSLAYQSIAMALVSMMLMVGLALFLARTRWGLAVRAVAQDINSARLMGVPVARLFPATMGIASALAGVAGVFLGGIFFAYPQAGDQPLLLALIVVIFGGLGSLQGTVYAAYAIGLIQAIVEVVLGTAWSLPILYAVILLILVVRPYGLMGTPTEGRL